MDGRLYLTLTTMLVVLSIIQTISVVIKKRQDKNFYQEVKGIDFFTKLLSICILIYGIIEILYFDEYTLTGSKIYLLVILLVILLAVVFFFLVKNFFKSKDFTAVNIKDAELLMIAAQILNKYNLKYEISENLSESLITLDQGEAVIKIKPEGIVSTSLSVKSIRFSKIYSYEDIIANLKYQINKSTKVNPLRGLGDLVVVISLLAFIFWMNTKMKFF
ncbi:MAG: hypothetical protein JM58_03565 [Peptococcaceae bacterium BICA1-8]|nr:MAG: hypothetical protein JM58_03565 [Peptococcaceae bacterium BICA1-8]